MQSSTCNNQPFIQKFPDLKEHVKKKKFFHSISNKNTSSKVHSNQQSKNKKPLAILDLQTNVMFHYGQSFRCNNILSSG